MHNIVSFTDLLQ